MDWQCSELWGILLFWRLVFRPPHCHGKDKFEPHKNTMQTTKTILYNWSLLNNKAFTITLRSKFDAQQKISETLTPNEEYENFVNAHMKSALKMHTNQTMSKA